MDCSLPGSSVHGIFQAKYWRVLPFPCPGQGIDLDYCGMEWFALEMNRYHSVVLGIASKYCISDAFVDCEGYSISSKGFLPVVVDIMVI